MQMDKHTLASFTINQIDKHGGSSNYLNDPWHPFQPTRTLVCRVICKKECLDVPTLVSFGLSPLPCALRQAKNKKLFVDATHVVVGAIYGAEAYCVFYRIQLYEEDD